MLKKLSHFYRHCPHCRTGILILVTMAIIVGAQLLYFYSEGDEFLGRLKRQSLTPKPALTKKGGNRAGLENIPLATVVTGENDPVTGEATLALHFCELEFKVGYQDNNYCFYPDLGSSATGFKQLVESHRLTYVPLFRPQTSDHKDVLDVDRWAAFITDFVRYLLNPNVNVLYVTSHGDKDAAIAVFSGFYDKNDDGQTKSFFEAVQQKVWEIITADSDLYEKLKNLGFDSFDKLFLSFLIPEDGGLWIGLDVKFINSIPRELRADAVFINTCEGNNIYPPTKIHVGQKECPPIVFAEDDFAAVFKGLSGFPPFSDPKTLRTITKLSNETYRSDLGFGNADIWNYSFSPAFMKNTAECVAGGSDIYRLKLKSDTALDPVKQPYRFHIEGNLEEPQLWGWTQDNDGNFVGFDASGFCSGACSGKFIIDLVSGAGSFNLETNTIWSRLNGNSNPVETPAIHGKEENYFAGDPDSHDPAVFEINCTGDGGGGGNDRPAREDAPPPRRPPVCGNTLIEQGEECDPPGTVCGSKKYLGGEGGKGAGVFIYKCDDQCQCAYPD